MTTKDAGNRAETHEAYSEGREQNSRGYVHRASNVTAGKENPFPKIANLIEAMVERENMHNALKRVEANKGAAGIDGMQTNEVRPYLKLHWAGIKEALLDGSYHPQPVRKVEIPKPGGGVRKLGIPNVVDRLIQQALHQVLSPIFEAQFSESSYGFRPGRSAHDALRVAKANVVAGRNWIVDIDLAKFFDCVNHDILMSRVARKISDKRVLLIIRRYLQAGLMAHGVFEKSDEGTPQGGPLSPLLSNIMLDDLDKELEKRGHKFARYADDCNTYVTSKRAGERVMASVTKFLNEKLKLKINESKSAVDRPWNRKFLGYSMLPGKSAKLRVAKESVKRFKASLKVEFQKGRGHNLGKFITSLKPKLQGWARYFSLAETKGIFEELDAWLRRKLRCILWRQWKRPLARARKMMLFGLEKDRAAKSSINGRGPWWNSGASHMNVAIKKKYLERCGLISLQDEIRRLAVL